MWFRVVYKEPPDDGIVIIDDRMPPPPIACSSSSSSSRYLIHSYPPIPWSAISFPLPVTQRSAVSRVCASIRSVGSAPARSGRWPLAVTRQESRGCGVGKLARAMSWRGGGAMDRFDCLATGELSYHRTIEDRAPSSAESDPKPALGWSLGYTHSFSTWGRYAVVGVMTTTTTTMKTCQPGSGSYSVDRSPGGRAF